MGKTNHITKKLLKDEIKYCEDMIRISKNSTPIDFHQALEAVENEIYLTGAKEMLKYLLNIIYS